MVGPAAQETSSFGFLAAYGPLYLRLAVAAERTLAIDPSLTLVSLRQLVEAFAKHVAGRAGLIDRNGPQLAQADLLRVLEQRGIIRDEIAECFHMLRRVGNAAVHDFVGSHQEALDALAIAFRLACWFHKTFGDNHARTAWQPPRYTPPTDPSKARYAEGSELDDDNLPELPANWAWTSLDYDGAGEAALRIPNLAFGDVDVADLKRFVKVLGFASEELIAEGDFLIARTNNSRDLIDRAACVFATDAAVGHYFASYLIRFRLVTPLVGRWLSLWWRSPFIRRWLELHSASSAEQYNVSLSTLATTPVSMANPDELSRVVELVEQGLDALRSLSDRFDRSTKAINNVEHSALAKAFRGELVEQDPADEPAAMLLARLRAEPSAVARTPTRQRRKRCAVEEDGASDGV